MADTKDISTKWKALRKPFPAETVGKLPRGNIELDYVGHAAVTDRLLEVDPGWTWEPLATDERNLPALDSKGNLWIKLTVCGVTRIGVGDGRNAKECIGDAIRNAAMRFGVALDLWSKEELESHHADPSLKNEKPSAKPAVGSPAPAVDPNALTKAQVQKIQILFNELGVIDRDDRLRYLSTAVGRQLGSSKELTKQDASKVIEQLQRDADALNQHGEEEYGDVSDAELESLLEGAS